MQVRSVIPLSGAKAALCAVFLLAGLAGGCATGGSGPQPATAGAAQANPDGSPEIQLVGMRNNEPEERIPLPIGSALFNVRTDSMLTRRFRTVVRQNYDFSCGAAAVATMLTYHYGVETGEAEVFKAMLKAGDPQKIQARGFSMLDMKGFLQSKGLRASGFRVSLEELAEEGVPAIQLINYRGYFHFVVIKGINQDSVLVGDPALGLGLYSREEFETLRANDIAFVILDQPEVGRAGFQANEPIAIADAAPLRYAIDPDLPQTVQELSRRTSQEFIFQGLD